MEASPLTQAHTHATKAAQLTSSASAQNLTVEILKEASSEHSLASDLFAKAIDLTVDIEARRTLELLKDHHRKLYQALSDAATIKATSKSSNSGGSGTNTPILIRSGSPGPTTPSETPTLRRGGSSNAEPDFSPQGFPPLSHPTISNPSRLGKSTSSLLASNLASKRGIPPMQSALSPVLSPATTPGASARRGNDFFTSNQLSQHLDAQRGPGSVSTKSRRGGDQPGHDGNRQPEAGFNRFYNSLETFVSRIGSPLAGPLGFAGMDLTPETKEASPSSPTTDGELIDGSTVPAHTDKDGYGYGYGVTEMVQNLMPKAWWSGQDHSQPRPTGKARGIFGGAGGARASRPAWQGGNESYYVVPTEQGDKASAASYAAVAGRPPSPSQDAADDYSPLRPKKTEGGRRNRGTADIPTTETIPEGDETKADLDQGKTMEELMLENQQLRQATDNLSRRLHTWEVNARDSRAMLDRSLMLYRTKPGTDSGNVGDEKNADREKELQMEIRSLNGKLVELEAELEQLRLHLEKERKENEKSTKKANYYKERWDKLKMDARAKELRKQQEGGSISESTPRSGGSRRTSMEAL